MGLENENEIDWSAIEIQLWPAERKLLLKYGYLWGPVQDALESMEQSRHIETIKISRNELQRLIGDVFRTPEFLCRNRERGARRPSRRKPLQYLAQNEKRPATDLAAAGVNFRVASVR